MALDVQVGDDAVAVRLSGADAVLSLKRSLDLEIGDIARARVVPRSEAVDVLGWRVGGAYLPGRAAAGHFTVKGRPGERAFCCICRDPEVLLIETHRKRPRYVALQHPDRHDLAWYIGERIG